MNILNRTISHLFLIAVFCLIAYSNTFDSSFHYDDKRYIVDNPVIKDLNNFVQLSSSEDFSPQFQYKTFSRRYLSYLSFALNYRLNGLNVTGYHYVNLFVHICTSLLVYFFMMLTFRTPYLRNSAIRDYAKHIALFTALLFVCHPLQTQAVTYIWQRVTSLCAMFYLLSLVAYIKWRLAHQLTVDSSQLTGNGKQGGRRLLYALSIISAVLAMKTKEIAFMLPVMLTLYELIFFKGEMKKRILYLIPFLLTMLIIPLTTISGVQVENLDDLLKGGTKLPRGEYLIAQFRVLVTYLRLVLLPVNQNLDYDYPRYYSFFNMEVFTSFAFLVALFGLSIYILFRYRASAPHTRLISFGILWFFINLLLESSLIPLYNVIFEHRMYLPSVGVFLAFITIIFMVKDRWRINSGVITVVLAVIIIMLCGATYARNSAWKDELTLWTDVVGKSPGRSTGHNNLGYAYESQGDIDRAIEQYLMSIELDPANSQAYNNLGNAYKSKGLLDSAIEQYLTAIKINPNNPHFYNNLGVVYTFKGLVDKAIQQYLIAIKIHPKLPHFYNNLGIAYTYKGLVDKAIEQYLTAASIDSYNPDAYYNLGNAYGSKGLIDKAMEQFMVAVRLKPDDFPDAHYNLGVAYYDQGLLDKAIKHYLLTIKLKPDFPEAHHNLGSAYKSRGDTELAVKEYNIALKLRPGWQLPLKELGKIKKER
jgi:tetratricopeptide (TPR) repeat protein